MEFITSITSTFWFQSIFKLILGAALSGIIGLERSSWNKPAGFRTYSLVGISSVLIMLCGEYMSNAYSIDPSRLPAQLLSGIGFIGAGTIISDGFNVKGLTTAAGLLSVTCIGLSIGAGFYLGGIFATLAVYLILSYSYKISDSLDHFRMLDLKINVNNNIAETISQIQQIFNEFDLEIKQIKTPKKGDIESSEQSITIISQYKMKNFNKNELLTKITSIETVSEIVEE